MEQGPFSQQIVAAFADMPQQLQTAARYVLDHPRDVALLSMREQARQASVNPATMTRLAKHLGVGGYHELRKRYAEAVRDGELGFAGRAVAQVKNQKLRGDSALAAEMMGSLARHFAEMANPDMAATLAAAARDLGGRGASSASACAPATALPGTSATSSRSSATRASSSTALAGPASTRSAMPRLKTHFLRSAFPATRGRRSKPQLIWPGAVCRSPR